MNENWQQLEELVTRAMIHDHNTVLNGRSLGEVGTDVEKDFSSVGTAPDFWAGELCRTNRQKKFVSDLGST